MNKRFELRHGKFGSYFYDNTVSVSMTLEDVVNWLNGDFLSDDYYIRQDLDVKEDV